jgi:hypothetical protein
LILMRTASSVDATLTFGLLSTVVSGKAQKCSPHSCNLFDD